jgi:hypothetical protein
MSPIAEAILGYLPLIIVGLVAIPITGILASVYNTRQKIKNGYPLEGMWGQSLKPVNANEGMERVKLLTQENAQLRAEVSAVKERLANVERIVTDSGFGLSQQIAALSTDTDSGQPLDLAAHRDRTRA